ncbi:MAG: nuclear transport factor 2 family protein [Candidatus Aminicenantes bacterium]|nr:nuclear transport factor 2 family protein [Candidatus Aminicenantes bacterium]
MEFESGVNDCIEIGNILKGINDAWINGHTEDLAEFFHEDIVVTGPGFRGGGTGRKACVASYEEFINIADIKDVKESELSINVWNDTAVAHYKFEIDYEIAGKDYHDSGYDLFVFARNEGKWLAVWRTILPVNKDD